MRNNPKAAGRFTAEDGFTLIELLVVMVVLIALIAGLVDLFTSGTHSEADQTARVGSQNDARLALNALRQDIHCASAVSSTATSTITLTMPSQCLTDPAPTTLNGGVTLPTATITVVSTANFTSGAANTIIIGGTSGAVTCTGTSATTFTGCSGGTGTFATASAVTNTKVTWCATGPTASLYALKRYYGGACSGANVKTYTTSLSSNAIFPTVVQAQNATALSSAVTLPVATIGVASTSGFVSGANTITVGLSGDVACTGITATSFTGCSGGTAGTYASGTAVRAAQWHSTVSLNLTLHQLKSDATEKFVASDVIALRNSGS